MMLRAPLARASFRRSSSSHHVVVGVAVPRGLAQADAVDDGRVIEAVADDGVFLGQQRLEHASVGVKGRGVQDRVLGVVKIRNALFQLFVDVLGATNEADARHAKSMGVNGPFGRFHHTRMGTQSQVVVRTKSSARGGHPPM